MFKNAILSYKMSQYFPKPYEPFGGDINVKVDLSNYATKSDIKNISHVDTSGFALKTNLASLKTEAGKLDIDKLVPAPVDLSKLSDVVKNDIVKKAVYNAKIKNIEDKVPDITNLATNTTLNAKRNEVKGETSSITNLANTNALTTVENKIPNVINLVEKTDYNTKISETESKITADQDCNKYITTQEFNKLTSENFTARMKQANLASKNDIANFVKKTDFDNKLKDLNKKNCFK